jgi:hypothetical protein
MAEKRPIAPPPPPEHPPLSPAARIASGAVRDAATAAARRSSPVTRATLWSLVMTVLCLAVAGWLFVREPVYRLLPPQGREDAGGRLAPREDANNCLRRVEQTLRRPTAVLESQGRRTDRGNDPGLYAISPQPSAEGPKGAWPADLDVRRFLYNATDEEGRPTVDPRMRSRTPWEASILDTTGLGGTPRLYISAMPTLLGLTPPDVPGEVAQGFVDCMQQAGYRVVDAAPETWTDWVERAALFF